MAAGAGIYVFTRSLAMALGLIAGGILIDLDHFIEDFSYRGIRFNLKEMFYLSCYNLYPRFYLLLHSYELVILLWIVTLFVIRSNFMIGLSIGFTMHLILDQIFNSAGRRFFYLFSYRVIKGFDRDRLQRPGAKGKPSPTPIERWRKRHSA